MPNPRGSDEISNAPPPGLKVGTHEGTSRRDLFEGLVPATSSHTVHTKGLVSPISMRLVVPLQLCPSLVKRSYDVM